jgi:hypothetical protein
MVHSAFASNRPLVLTFLVLPAIVLIAVKFYHPSFYEYELAGPPVDLLINLVSSFPLLRILFGMLLILGNAILLNVIYNAHDLSAYENYFPALIFFAYACLDPDLIDLHPVFFSLLFLLLALRRLLALYRSTKALTIGFDAGFFLGTAALCFPPMALVLPLIWITFGRLRPFNIKEWLAPVAGLLTVATYAFAYYYIGEYQLNLSEFFSTGELLSEFPEGDQRLGVTSIAAITILLMALGLFLFVLEFRKSTLRKKNNKFVFLWTSLLLLATFFYVSILRSEAPGYWLIMGIPVSVFGGIYFSGRGRRKQVRVIFFYAWLIAYAVYIIVAD